MRAWLEPVFDAAQMRAVDNWAIEQQGVPSLQLMEAAGRALAEAVTELAGNARVAVICGGGNNGGDGLVAARRLAGIGQPVEIVMVARPERISTEAAANLERLPAGVRLTWAVRAAEVAAALARSELAVDALLGTGFSGPPREPVAGAIEAINDSGLDVVVADIASGVDASSGEVVGAAVKATVTIGFHATKVGHLVAPGKTRCGQLGVVPIGIPPGVVPEGPVAGRIGPEVLAGLTARGPQSTKFSSGQVVVVGGSRGLTGAPCMAAVASTRAGAGYATVAVPHDLEPIFEQKLTEVMSVACPGPQGRLGAEALETIIGACKRAAAVVIGPGAGRDPETATLMRDLAARIEAPVVIDADGLSAFGDVHLDLLANRRQPTVLTPHEGEMGRLLGRPSEAVADRRLASAAEAARRAGALVVLKGDDTLVTDGEAVAINALAAPALATAGTGDVLAGVIAALLARLEDPFQAACAAVYAHARAGRAAADEIGLAESVIASDVIAALPRGLRR